jgi:metal-responsive CopG/Arc/MetJ family transcriptional regulator
MRAVRLNIMLPEQIVREIEKRSKPRKRNQFILKAVERHLETLKKQELEALLEEGYKATRREALCITKEFESVDLEGWDEY